MQLFKTYLNPIVRTDVSGHIGFEAKQEMKPYYNIVHKPFRHFGTVEAVFFQDGVTHVSDNTEYKMF